MSDIKNFFRLKLLDIKFVTDTWDGITTGQYFENVNKFLNDAPQFVLNINHMRIVRSDNFFLNDLECFNGIISIIDDFFIEKIENFKEIVLHIGARNLAYMIDDLEKQFTSLDLSRRNAFMLRICVDINELYNTIKRVYSAKDKGLQQPWDEIPLNNILQELAIEERTRKMQVIVVDDMPVVLNTILNILKKHYEVYAFTKGDQALKFLKNKIPDLFLLDIEMPGMSGYELYNEIKKMKEHKNTPIIFMTGNVTNEYLETAISIGVSDFIAKPVDEQILLKKIWNNVDRKKLF